MSAHVAVAFTKNIDTMPRVRTATGEQVQW